MKLLKNNYLYGIPCNEQDTKKNQAIITTFLTFLKVCENCTKNNKLCFLLLTNTIYCGNTTIVIN